MKQRAKTQESRYLTYSDIQPHDMVTIHTTIEGQTLTGRAVMKGPAGWVLNCGGRYGIPAICDETNFVQVRRTPTRKRAC